MPSKVGSIKNLKKSLKASQNSSISRIPKDDGCDVRFLTEPDEWWSYFEYYDEDDKTYVVVDENDKSSIPEDTKLTKRYLAAVYNVDDDAVQAMKIPVTVANDVEKALDVYGSITNRDFRLTNDGEGLNTEYGAIPLDKEKRNTSKYKLPDLGKILADEIARDHGDDDDEDDAPNLRKKKGAATKTKGKASTSKSKPTAKKVVKKTTTTARRRPRR